MTARRPYTRSSRDLARDAEVARWGRRIPDDPQEGFFAVRMVKGGVEVAARLERRPSSDPVTGEPLDGSWHWIATVNGVPDPHATPEPNDLVLQIWITGRRIDEQEYAYLVADRAWARRYAPESPEANPKKKIDWRTLPLPFD